MPRANRTGVYELDETPELYDLFRTFGRRLKLSLRTNTVGTVTAYDPIAQKATVTCDILQIVKAFTLGNLGAFEGTANVDNSEITQPPAILTNIPVVWPRCGLGYLTFPLNPGDTGTVTIMDRSIQQWLLDGVATDPIAAATHALQDAVFEPGLHPNTNPITPPTDTTAAVLHHDAFVKLGRAAALGVARLTDQTTANVSMTVWMGQVTAMLVAIATVWNALQPAGGPFVVPALTPIVPPIPATDFGVVTTASTKVKSE